MQASEAPHESRKRRGGSDSSFGKGPVKVEGTTPPCRLTQTTQTTFPISELPEPLQVSEDRRENPIRLRECDF
jgi:hypothetical protein